MDRGKVLWEEDLEKMAGKWARYRDVDGDGITYRTLMGNRHPDAAYFARGTGHTEEARYSELPDVWEKNMHRIQLKWETAKTLVPKPMIESTGEKIGFIAFGSTDPAIEEARHILRTKHNVATDYMQVKAIPFTADVDEFIASHDRVFIVELNRDGQMFQILSLAYPQKATAMVSLAHLDGMPLTARWVVDAFLAKEN
jgi:2-oxoglutarate ferredoxin oxidoreductase subunit alpha